MVCLILPAGSGQQWIKTECLSSMTSTTKRERSYQSMPQKSTKGHFYIIEFLTTTLEIPPSEVSIRSPELLSSSNTWTLEYPLFQGTTMSELEYRLWRKNWWGTEILQDHSFTSARIVVQISYTSPKDTGGRRGLTRRWNAARIVRKSPIRRMITRVMLFVTGWRRDHK